MPNSSRREAAFETRTKSPELLSTASPKKRRWRTVLLVCAGLLLVGIVLLPRIATSKSVVRFAIDRFAGLKP
ncbi:MAG: hypothetical protein AAGG44_13370, partial [Planctomycetota bacterium]